MIWAAVETLGVRIKEALDRKGWKEIRLAAEVGTVESTVKRWIADEVRPRLETVPTIADALDVSISWLLTGEDEIADEPQTLQEMRDKLELVAELLHRPTTRVRNPTTYEVVDGALAALRELQEELAKIEAALPPEEREAATVQAFSVASEAWQAALKQAADIDPSLEGARVDEVEADEAARDAEAEVPPAGEAVDPQRREGDRPSRRSA